MKMEVHSSQVERKLVAVISSAGGFFIRNEVNPNASVYIDSNGLARRHDTTSLESLLVLGGPGRTGVYEGDKITLTF